ncbi:hypothetical protein GCM10027160_03160 [Streptomyces calidiresistens]
MRFRVVVRAPTLPRDAPSTRPPGGAGTNGNGTPVDRTPGTVRGSNRGRDARYRGVPDEHRHDADTTAYRSRPSG